MSMGVSACVRKKGAFRFRSTTLSHPLSGNSSYGAPQAAPALFTTAILAFIAAVNEYLLASQLSSDRTEPVTVAIARFSGNDPHVVPYAAIMAAGTIVAIPLVIMVLLFQRRIISGLTAGGVKS